MIETVKHVLKDYGVDENSVHSALFKAAKPADIEEDTLS